MSRLLRIFVAVTIAVLGSACRAPAPAAAPDPQPALATVAPALRPCLVLDAEVEQACLEAALLELLDRGGVEAAMAALEEVGEVDGDARRDGHLYAHAIGLAAYSPAEEVGVTFARCTPSFQSGCYHGVVQAYFAAHASRGGHLDAATVDGLCRAQRGQPAARWLLFQCAHGLGHGVTALRGYELPEALAACDLVASLWEREACYGGVFMESMVQATMPHHGVGRPEMEVAHGGVGHAEHGSGGASGHEHGAGHHHATVRAPSFPPLDPARPLYPCTELEARYLDACYKMQTSAVLYFNGGDFAAAAAACDGAPAEFRHTCYQSLGRDVSSYTLQDHAGALRLCSLGDPAYRPWCHIGYAKHLVDLTARVEDGLAYCRLVPEPEGKRHCYTAMGEQLWALGEGEERAARVCAGVEPAFVEACREGAALPTAGAASQG